MRKGNFRNIAIISHVDHGKTTLVDDFVATTVRPQIHDLAGVKRD